MKPHKLLAALLCAATPCAYGASDNPQLEILVVTGTRIEQPLKQSLSHTTVITRQQIEESQAVDVASVLRDLAGVEYYQSGGIGKQGSLFMRGTNSSHVLILLDGVRINSATAGTTQIDQLMLDQIDRIEVVRGNVSSLYGSEAIGGVIQLFTRRGKGAPSFNVSGGGGTHNTQRAAAGFSGGTGDTSFDIQVSRIRTDGVSSIKSSLVPTVNPDRDGYDNTSFSANLNQNFNADHGISLSVFNSLASSQTDNSFGLQTDVNESRANIRKVALVSDNGFSDAWQSKLQWSQGLDDTQNFLNGAPDLALGAQFKTGSDQLAWQNTLQLGNQKAFSFGVEQLKQRVSSSTAYTRTSRTDDSMYVGYSGVHGAHQSQLNLRRDRYSDFGNADTGLLGYGYELNDAWRLTASTGTAFKAPTLNDLFYPFVNYGFGFTYAGNPNLKPERSRNKELGLHYSTGSQRVDVAWFDNRIRDLIVNNNLSASTMTNLGEARIDGIEMVYDGQAGDAGVHVALTLQNPRDSQTRLVLLRRAKSFANVRMTQQYGTWQISGEFQYSGKREDIDINTFARTTLDSYSVVNISASHDLSWKFKLYARVDNLFDRDYMLAHGYNTLGRTFFVGLNYRLQD